MSVATNLSPDIGYLYWGFILILFSLLTHFPSICSIRLLSLYIVRLTAKDSRMWKIIVPLVMGFKSTGILIFAITAVKLFLLKALMISKIALLAAGFLVGKKLMSSVGVQEQPYQQHPYLLANQPLHYYNDQGLVGGLPTGYAYSNYVTAGGNYGSATGNGFGASASDGVAATAADDLQAHFTSNVLTSAQAITANHTTTRKDGNSLNYKIYFGNYN